MIPMMQFWGFEFIKGFYKDSLTAELQQQMLENPPSIVHIDVDLYSSTIEVLEWLDKISLPMAIYIFDDICIFWGSILFFFNKSNLT